jgi:hypothetical protein
MFKWRTIHSKNLWHTIQTLQVKLIHLETEELGIRKAVNSVEARTLWFLVK